MAATQRPNKMRNGRFTIIRPLTKGGMGALFLASETIATGTRKVVIKEMLDYYDSGDPQGQSKAQRRFEAEAITLANLSIPGIPQIFDYFTEGGRNYIVMQFVEGQNLETGLTRLDERGYPHKGKPYPVEDVRRWGMEICKLLEALAAQNVIHMDIKPANLIVDKSGRVWLVDFGTSKGPRLLIPGASPGSSPGASPSKLQKSSVFGTIGYAAPEQTAGKPEPRSDVYALASTLYHLATDDDPGAHPSQYPRLDRLPPDLATALRRALNVDVRQRITASDFARALEPRTTRQVGFHWQDGSISQDPVDLALAADARWEEARAYFAGQALENWLQDMHRHDLVARIGQIKSQLKDPDLGLDAFLRTLNPQLPAAALYVPVTVIDAGTIPWRSQRILDIELINAGAGAYMVRLANPPAGFRPAPDLLAVHRRATLKLLVDSNALTPAVKPQVFPLTLDAGPAGRVRLRIRLTIPAPLMEVEPLTLDLGAVYRGQAVESALFVRNAGNSAFQCEITCQMPETALTPSRFECLPGSEQLVSVVTDTRQFGFGYRSSKLSVQAQAGNWQDTRSVPIQVSVSYTKTFWRVAKPALAWAVSAGLLGAFLGWVIATLSLGVGAFVSSAGWGLLAGALIGTLVCILPATFLGVLGWLSHPPGKAGLQFGLILGGSIGVLAGGLVGVMLGWVVVGVEAFGVWVGGFSAAVLGVFLQHYFRT